MLLTIEKVAVLKSADIFARTPDHVLASVAGIVEEVDVTPGETFIHEDKMETEMYVIVEGEVRVHKNATDITTFGPGAVVGEMETLAPAARAASVSAVSETRLFRIPKDAFDEVMADRPEIAQGVIRVLVERLRAETMSRG
ncbi:MAG: Crp/Fnr family transcriptional regulator [Chloroflexi bacterium]|nr:MAG: Crp/Fnr family transcriptional regulator [Chloroflexota bacterium]